jgi:hypothetical protein
MEEKLEEQRLVASKIRSFSDCENWAFLTRVVCFSLCNLFRLCFLNSFSHVLFARCLTQLQSIAQTLAHSARLLHMLDPPLLPPSRLPNANDDDPAATFFRSLDEASDSEDVADNCADLDFGTKFERALVRGEDDESLLQEAWLLERVARALARVRLLLPRAAGFGLHATWAAHAHSQHSLLREKLTALFLRALHANHEMGLSCCLRAFSFGALRRECEQTVRGSFRFFWGRQGSAVRARPIAALRARAANSHVACVREI